MPALTHRWPFPTRLREALGEMLGSEVEKATKFGLAKDGSGVGGEYVDERNGGQQLTPQPASPAALCALQAKKQQQSDHHPHMKAH